MTGHVVSFSQLADAIGSIGQVLSPGARLKVASMPDPFIPPELRMTASNSLAAEVIFVKASAAVGKTTMAKALSAHTGAPLLNLADVPVSTHSLVGLLTSEFSGPSDPVKLFHKGQRPLIIDSLDEGRLRSGEEGIEQFLVTTGELLDQSREETSRPKLIVLGRPDSVELAEAGLHAGGELFTRAFLEVDFFREEAARQLIEAYARAAAKPDAPFQGSPVPVRELVDAYFESIESALNLTKGELWSSDRGRAFAGHAPILAALGILIANVDNFAAVRSRVRASGPQEAWSVIESVLREVLAREKQVFNKQLSKKTSVPVPDEAYDAEEQLTFLSRLIHGQSLVGTHRVKLPASDLSTYHGMVEQRLPEHPFVRQGEPANAVLGSLILAYAIRNDLLGSADLTMLAQLSRQPFVWRALNGMLERESTLLDGRYLGYVLNSLWSEPIRADLEVTIRSTTEGETARAFVQFGEGRMRILESVPPIWLYGQARRCDIDIDGGLEIHGQAVGQAGSAFFVYGPVQITCEALTVATDSIIFDGRAWLEAESVIGRPQLRLHMKAGTEVGWGGIIKNAHPWNRFPSTIDPPNLKPPSDVFEALIDECSRRLHNGAVITLHTDYSNPGDPRLRWIERQFSDSFPALINLMLTHGLASSERLQAGGEEKVRVRFGVRWDDLRKAVRSESGGGEYAKFIVAARQSLARS